MRLRVDSSAQAPRALAVSTIGILGLAGGLLAVGTAALPPAAKGSETVILILGSMSTLTGALLLWLRPTLSEPTLAALSLIGTAVISVATNEGGIAGGTADNEILYLWVILYAFYFLTLPHAIFQLAVVGAAYAWVLSGQDVAGQGATQWLVTMSSLTMVGLLAAGMRGSLYRHVDELSERASRDELTGLLNRGSLYERFAIERARALRSEDVISVLAIDVDEFKALNDTLGHPTGDQALRQVAAALQHWTRDVDAVARIGGDEFAVILPGVGPADSLSISTDLCAAIARSPLHENVRITVSIGATTSERPVPSFGELWQAADAAMYEAKRSGGDRVRYRESGDGAGPVPVAHPLSKVATLSS